MPKRNDSADDRAKREPFRTRVAVGSVNPIERTSLATARRSLAIWIWSAVLIADLILVARLASGELSVALPPSIALVSMVVVAIASCLAWCAFRSDSTHQNMGPWSESLPVGISVIGPAVWCGALATQASPLALGMLLGVTLFQWLAMLLTVSVGPRLQVSSPLPQTITRDPKTIPSDESLQGVASRKSSATPRGVSTTTVVAEAGHLSHVATVLDASASDEVFVDHRGFSEPDETMHGELEHGDDVTQWMLRRMTDDGEVVEGWVRVEFLTGQRDATVHVSFCPPLCGPPEIQTEDLDGADLEVRIGTAFPFGARLAVRRTGSIVESCSGRIGLIASVAVKQRAA